MREISSENTSFNYLRGSGEFLNTVLNNISSCVLLLDQDMKLQAFNDAMKTIFSNKPNEHLIYQRCGEAIGCAATVEERKECGSTSKCGSCELRKCALKSYTEDIVYYKNRISKEFFRVDDYKEVRHLQFSTRCIRFNGDRYVMMVIDDLTPLINQSNLLSKQERLIDKLKNKIRTLDS